MIEAFFAVFAVAFFLTIYTLVVVEEDLDQKSYRPAVVLFAASIAWFTTISLLITPTTNTIATPAYNITTLTTTSNVPLYCTTTNAICGMTTQIINSTQRHPAYNQTTMINSPLPTYAFYEYMAFAGAMALICLLGFALYMIKMSTVELIDSAKGFLK